MTDGKAFAIIVKVVERNLKAKTCFAQLEHIIEDSKSFEQKEFCH